MKKKNNSKKWFEKKDFSKAKNEIEPLPEFYKYKEKAETLEKKFVNIFKNNSFIMYGAGGGGLFFLKAFCEKYNLYPKVILDKEGEKHPNKDFFEVHNLKISKPENETFKRFPQNIPIVISIAKKELQEEIKNNLQLLGFKNLYLISEDIFDYWYLKLWDAI